MSLVCDELSVEVDGIPLLPPTSYRVEQPSLVALTGPNGAGKTTLLKVIAGRMLPTYGACTLSGLTPNEFDPAFRASVASLIDTPPIARDMTLVEQLTLVGLSWGTNTARASSEAHRLLKELLIPDLGDRFPHVLSAGQLQLFALALTLSRPAGYLLLDEPERHLDQARVRVLIDLLHRRVEEGTVVLTATHREEIINSSSRQLHLAPAEASPERSDAQ